MKLVEKHLLCLRDVGFGAKQTSHASRNRYDVRDYLSLSGIYPDFGEAWPNTKRSITDVSSLHRGRESAGFSIRRVRAAVARRGLPKLSLAGYQCACSGRRGLPNEAAISLMYTAP